MASALALGAAGCGANAPASKPTANVSIVAPISGATVGVHQVEVAGTVAPANAQVLVGGLPAQVHNGSYTRELWLAQPNQVVTVSAQAPGYRAAYAHTTISYSPQLAGQLLASSKALSGLASAGQGPAKGGSAPTAGAPSSAGSSALSQAVALPTQGSTTSHSPSPAPTPAPSTTIPTSTTTTPASNPTTRPPATVVRPVLTAARIRSLWEHGWLKSLQGRNLRAYRTCIYARLVHTGVFRTLATVEALLARIRTAARTGNLGVLSPAIRSALLVCAVKLPAQVTIGGKPTLAKLAGQSHGSVPAPPLGKPAGK